MEKILNECVEQLVLINARLENLEIKEAEKAISLIKDAVSEISDLACR